jgi:hypothetical protein
MQYGTGSEAHPKTPISNLLWCIRRTAAMSGQPAEIINIEPECDSSLCLLMRWIGCLDCLSHLINLLLKLISHHLTEIQNLPRLWLEHH